MRGVCEPTAIETKIWMGPVHGISSEPSIANLVSSHVLRLDASPDTTESEANLDMRLKKLWIWSPWGSTAVNLHCTKSLLVV